MRPIKFRAWDTVRKRMFSANEMGRDQLTLSPDGRGFINVHSASTRLSSYLPHLLPLQFTGLLDKNGEEIWEGDIVKWISLILPITVDDFHGYTFMYGKDRLFRAVAEDGEVIGNIYENPELLKETP